MVYRDDRDALLAQLESQRRELEQLRDRAARLEASNRALSEEVTEWRRRFPPPPEPPPRSPGSTAKGLLFQITEPGAAPREVRIGQAVIKIGKLPSSHLRLADDSVSRMHAVIEVSGDDVSIIDLGSSAGTRVNGEAVSKSRLRSGDLLQLGATYARVYFE